MNENTTAGQCKFNLKIKQKISIYNIYLDFNLKGCIKG